MQRKEFKTIEEQIEILRSRGLLINDEKVASEFLVRNNYYRISGYSLTLRDHDVFSKNASFKNIIDIYEFDHDFRHILLNYIEEIEVTIKSIYAYEFSKEFTGIGYLNQSLFTNEEKYTCIMEKAEKQKEKRRESEAYIKHYVEELHEELPLWAYVDLLTISDISILYSISPETVKTAVSAAMGINKNPEILGRFMHSLTIVRNLCAHGGRLYNRLFEQKPRLNKEEQGLLIRNKDNTIDNTHLYGFVIIMKRLLLPESFSTMKNDIIKLLEKYPFINMKYYGFREDWQEKL